MWFKSAFSLALVVTIATSGCSWRRPTEQSVPAVNGGSDNIQFFPAGAEDKLFNQRRAIEEYKAAQAAAEAAEADREAPLEGTHE